MSSQVQSHSWWSGSASLVPQPVVNFLARRRIAISLSGFTLLGAYNVWVRRTTPLNPLDWQSPVVWTAFVLLIVGLCIRSWSAGTLNKSRELTTVGPYAVSRNPLYIGSFLMMFGFCIFCRDWPTLVFVAGPMACLYRLQVMFEEQRLARLFPTEWPEYSASTPRFFPRSLPPSMFAGWTQYEWLRNREYRAVIASILGVVAVWLWHGLQTQVI